MITENPRHTEHVVGRHAILVLNQFFSFDEWNYVPEFRAQSNRIPDLALETFHPHSKLSGGRFTARVFVEFKTLRSTTDGVQQLKDSIRLEFGRKFKSRGFLILIRAKFWTILEYHFVMDENEQPQLITCNFFHNSPDITTYVGDKSRPSLSSATDAGEGLDYSKPEERSLIHKVLRWIGIEKMGGRDLSGMLKNSHCMTDSLSMMGSIETEDYGLVEMGNDDDDHDDDVDDVDAEDDDDDDDYVDEDMDVDMEEGEEEKDEELEHQKRLRLAYLASLPQQ